jgi:hypothetical protein
MISKSRVLSRLSIFAFSHSLGHNPTSMMDSEGQPNLLGESDQLYDGPPNPKSNNPDSSS